MYFSDKIMTCTFSLGFIERPLPRIPLRNRWKNWRYFKCQSYGRFLVLAHGFVRSSTGNIAGRVSECRL